MNKLAIYGGKKIRTKEFVSKPHIDNNEIRVVNKLLKHGIFSRFVGSPLVGTRELLKKESSQLNFKGPGSTFLGGEYVRKFEYKWSELTSSKYSISVNSATSGLISALLSLNLPENSEVITTPFSFTATGAAIPLAKCVPKFVDINKDTFCMDPLELEKRITNKTKALIYVHWCGNPGHFNKILKICKKRNIKIIEDAAQVPGTEYKGKHLGTFGDIGVYSFNEPKNIMTGEGGMVVTNNEKYAIKLRLIRNHGEAIVDENDSLKFINNVVGYNFRLTELQAAIGCEQINKLEYLNGIRKENYEYLILKLRKLNLKYLKPQKIIGTNNYSAYTAAFQWDSERSQVHRDLISDILTMEGIPNFKGYPVLMSEQEHIRRGIVYKKLKLKDYILRKENNIQNNVAKDLSMNKFIGFFTMGWPNTIKDIDDIINAWGKIKYYLKDLKNKKYKIDNTFKLGRK